MNVPKIRFALHLALDYVRHLQDGCWCCTAVTDRDQLEELCRAKASIVAVLDQLDDEEVPTCEL